MLMLEEHSVEIIIFVLSIAFTAWAAVVKKSADRLICEIGSLRNDMKTADDRMNAYVVQTERRITRLENIAETFHLTHSRVD